MNDAAPDVSSTSGSPSSTAAPTATQEKVSGGGLYAAHKKIYVRAVGGLFSKWRWALVWLTQIIFYGLPWLTWNDRQAVLLHLVDRKFYIFDWVFWPKDAIFLTALLIISAYSLFFFTAIAGRLWCGYVCPQTVYTEIFLWIEQKLEGDHVKRMKLDKAPMSGHKFALKATKYVIWSAVALWTGFTFVAYFSPVRELLASVSTFNFGPWETFWILFYGAFTFMFAGVMREQVCKFMCPYARFQAVMFDPDTLVITYDQARGEPRCARRKAEDPATKGHCIDCGICVQVCPVGIDIRNGLQYECIGCALCIDACDGVMDKVGMPRGLVRFSSENAIEKGWKKKEIVRRALRARTMIYGVILLAVCSILVCGLATRTPLRVDVIPDRVSFGREIPGGLIENDFQLQVMNMSEKQRSFVFKVTGLPDAQIRGEERITVDSAQNYLATLQVLIPITAGKPGTNGKIFFEISPEDDPGLIVREKATFFFPR